MKSLVASLNNVRLCVCILGECNERHTCQADCQPKLISCWRSDAVKAAVAARNKCWSVPN